jgi:lipopolysaccharide export LptBFGC system permease protein LptF
MDFVFRESRRVLKKDGRMFISIGDFDGQSGLINRFISKFKSRGIIDVIEDQVSDLNMVIDKNYILNDHRLYLEVVKLESEYIKKRIAI